MDSLSSSGSDNQIDIKDVENKDANEVETGQNEEEDLGPTWIPLEMENIIEQILGYLDLDSLKSARQVNKLWNCEGIKIMFKAFFIGVSPEFHSNKNPEEQKEEYETFLSYNSFKIPHLSINFEKDADVLKSVKVFEENVKEIKSLRWTEDEEKSQGVLKELLHKSSSLNYLDVSPFIPRGLKKIIINFCIDTKTRLNHKIKNQKPLVISNFELSLETDELDFFGDLEKFTKCDGVMVKNLWVLDLSGLDSHPHLQNRFIKMINNILHSSQKVVTELTLDSCELYLSQLQFPPMPNLTECSWEFDTRHPGLNLSYGLHPSFKFAEMTPHLKKFQLVWFGGPNERQEIDLCTKFFEFSGPASSVKELRYFDNFSDYNIEKLLQVFPNLQQFDHLEAGNFESAATSIWKFGLNIKRLYLQIRISEEDTELSSFDRILTGFSQETVHLIQNSNDRVVSDVENLRVNPSILDLKGLETFTFDFHGDLRDSSLPRRILEVAGDFAFKLMPNVKIAIIFRVYGAGSAAIRAASEKVSQLPNVNVDYR